MGSMFRTPTPLAYDSLQSMITNWKSWRKEFQTFMIAAELNAKPELTKVSIFLNLIGHQGNELYESFVWGTAEEKTLEAVLKKFEDHMAHNDNVTVNRYAFWSHNQEEGQSLDDYIKELTLLRHQCRFQDDNNINDSLLRDRIIYGIRDKSLQEKLLRLETDKSNLKTVIAVCRSHEISQQHSSMMEDSSNVCSIGRNPTQKPSTRMNKEKISTSRDISHQNTSQQNTSQQRTSQQKITDCKFCGYDHIRGQCIAYGKECNFCHKLNHFERVCMQKQASIRGVSSENTSQQSNDNNIQSISANMDTFFISSIVDHKKPSDTWKTKLTINGEIDVWFKIDSGAEVSVLSAHDFYRLQNAQHKLFDTNVCLRAYNKTRIPVKGECNLNVRRLDGKECQLKFIIADFDSILSGTHSEELNVCLQ